MRVNANRTLRSSLAVTAALLVLAESAFPSQAHAARAGESLYQIAKQHSTSVSAAQSRGRLTSTTAAGTSTTYGISQQSRVAVKSGGRVVASLRKGARFLVLERDSGKLNIKLPDGKSGWINADHVRMEDTRKPLPAGDSWSQRSNITRTACMYRGARYVRGGTSGAGFDCSGFVRFLYARQGIKLPHSSSAQYQCGTPVSRAALQPGDVVFFAGTYRHGISHVGLYLGGGKFIHASTSRGGVRIDDLTSDYYRRKYAGARRIR